MAVTAIVEGNLGGDPELRYTRDGRAVANLSIGATARRKNNQSDNWEDNGEPLWVQVTLWEEQAEWAANTLHKGERVFAKGTLIVESWTNEQGIARQSFALAYPQIGICPPRDQKPAPPSTQSTQPQPAQQTQEQGRGEWGKPEDDPWAIDPAPEAEQQTLVNEPPF